MIIKTLRLGLNCTDKGTGLPGMITHWIYDMGGRVDYLFQPKGINPENGQPVEKIGLEIERLDFPKDSFEEVDIPTEVLGTTVTDNASGFSGMAVSFVRHINGCFHVMIQPPGALPKTNSAIRRADFDLRQCSGEKIKVMEDEEMKASKKNSPSPTGDTFEKHLPSSGSIAGY